MITKIDFPEIPEGKDKIIAIWDWQGRGFKALVDCGSFYKIYDWGLAYESWTNYEAFEKAELK